MIEYTLNFVIWTYYKNSLELLKLIKFRLLYILILTKTLPMLMNFYKPLFGDPTITGLFIGIFIRFFWILGGLIISIIYITPFILMFLGYVLLIFLPLIQTIRLIIS